MSYGLLPAVLCLLFGSGLVILEVLLPGFGLPGVSGIVLLCGGTYFLGKVVGAAMAVIIMAETGFVMAEHPRSSIRSLRADQAVFWITFWAFFP